MPEAVQTTQKKWRKEYQLQDEQGNAIGPPQVFEADTPEELTDMLATAHQNAARKLREVRQRAAIGEQKPDPAREAHEFKPRVLSTDEQFRISQELQNPATMAKALDELISARLGGTPEQIAGALETTRRDERRRWYLGQIEQFCAAHPDYKRTKANQTQIIDFLAERGWELTTRNLTLAFGSLKLDGLVELQSRQEPRASETAREDAERVTAGREQIGSTPTVTTRTRSASTGLSSRNSLVSPGDAPRGNRMPTRAEIDRMSSAEYNERLRDPQFARYVDNLPPA